MSKKKLKKIAGALAAGLGAAALMNRRNQNKLYEYEEGGDLSRPSLPMSKRQVEGLNFPVGTDLSGMSRLASAGSIDRLKKGGRVGVGKAKRGFGRAMKGRK